MKSIFFRKKFLYLLILPIIISLLIMSCNAPSEHSEEQRYSTKKSTTTTIEAPKAKNATAQPSPRPGSTTTLEAPMAQDKLRRQFDSMVLASETLSIVPRRVDSLKVHPIDRSPVSVPTEGKIAKGIVMVYCPPTMLKGIPSIVNATISKEEVSTALANFTKKMQVENPEQSRRKISSNIKSDSIDLYERMEVIIEFDSDDFKQIAEDENLAKSFGNKNILEWEWEIKPLHTTSKSIINFKFYYLNPNENTPNYIFEKTFSIVVKVDPRSYVDKWKDFLFGDAQNTTTAILIPLCTFLGGFISGKKKKKVP